MLCPCPTNYVKVLEKVNAQVKVEMPNMKGVKNYINTQREYFSQISENSFFQLSWFNLWVMDNYNITQREIFQLLCLVY